MQKSERLNAAHRLIAQGIGMAEAAMMLAREYDLSRRQAYRYLAEAQRMVRPAPAVEQEMVPSERHRRGRESFTYRSQAGTKYLHSLIT